MTERRIKSRLVYHYLHDPSALAGSVLLVVFVLLALFAPLIAPQNPYDLETVIWSTSCNHRFGWRVGAPRFCWGRTTRDGVS